MKDVNELRQQFGLPPIDQIITIQELNLIKTFNIQPMQLHEQRQVIDIDYEIIQDDENE